MYVNATTVTSVCSVSDIRACFTVRMSVCVENISYVYNHTFLRVCIYFLAGVTVAVDVGGVTLAVGLVAMAVILLLPFLSNLVNVECW